MPQDLLTSLPVAPELVAAGFGILVVLLLLRRIAVALRRRRIDRDRAAAQARAATEAEAPDAAEAEPDADLPGTLYPMPVLSHGEARLLEDIDGAVRAARGGCRVLAQLSLNAFLYGCASGRARRQDPAVVRLLSELRVDFLIVDAEWRPVLAVDVERGEFSAAPIEERTMQALERAGIAHIIVTAEGLTEAQRGDLMRQLGPAQGVAAE
ncbi:MAG: DUF2726 domain-containing protein [Roseicyclus sp.]